MIAEDFLAILFRISELAFSVTALGLTSSYLYTQEHNSVWSKGRFIYADAVASLGVLCALLFLLPFTYRLAHFPIDFTLFILFMISYVLVANYIAPLGCGNIWNWSCITGEATCQKLKTELAFSFLAAMFFLASAMLGLWVTWRYRRTINIRELHPNGRWYLRPRTSGA